MSNVSGASSGSSVRPRGRFVGVPKICWCGEHIVELISRSTPNPYRRYYRCAYAVSKKLSNDSHTFKWVDEAFLDEIEILQMKNVRIEKELNEIAKERNEFEKMVFEKVIMDVEKEIFERVEAALAESSSTMKKMMILIVIGCMIMVGCSKLLG